ncbi:MAG: sigma-70 family RNA polymerase sigma factor [Bacteroidetes bacterium]|nr:sigma-70 family RNA polymerase sigma factor [Bacteroidota bacterium]
MTVPAEVLDQCLLNEPRGQEALYKAYSARMYGICLRYAGNRMEAEDILQEGFIKVFKNLSHLHSREALDAWIRRIMVNTAINYYTKQLKFQNEVSLKYDSSDATIQEDALSKLSYNELLRILQGLPTGYRTVFNLYVIDGYSHREIGEMLGIAENTSKSQLWRAKASMKKILRRIL